MTFGVTTFTVKFGITGRLYITVKKNRAKRYDQLVNISRPMNAASYSNA